MRDGVCVKCEAEDVYSVDGLSGAYQDLNLGGWALAPFSAFYVCGACGFAERYVHSDELYRLPKKGERVPRR